MRHDAAATTTAADAHDAAFNPLVALQALLAADVASAKQRVRAAQQLQRYFARLSPTPGLLLSYEPYLPLLTETLGAPQAAKGASAQELQAAVLALLLALSSHNPAGFSDWMARNTQLGNEPWLVQWSYALLLQTEKTVPRRDSEADGEQDAWDENSPQFKEFDRAFARVLHMWRTLLDHTADVALVDQLVKYLQVLLVQQQEQGGDKWRTMMLKKLQTHFVDIADVLIGWMMSTGPHGSLREEILTLLHHFGRLWADNSVFSMQLLNSFADEIVNLCNSWDDHQEGDDDRLSTLLTCFMMLAQCVLELALPTEGSADSSFVRVLDSVASCLKPEYSLFCLANCSEYMVTMSRARHSNFYPHSVAAVNFLLYHCAVQAQMHGSEVEKLATVMKNACTLASANFSRVERTPPLQAAAVRVLEGDIPTRIVKKGGQPKRVKVMECLFQVHCARGLTHITQLCLHLLQLGGVGALKALGTRAFQRLNSRHGGKGNSYFVFAATCFILASRDSEMLFASGDEVTQAVGVLELAAAKLEKQSHRHRQHRLTPRQLCLVLKMASTFMSAVSRFFVGHHGVAETVKGVAHRLLECAVHMLPSETVVVRDYRLTVETLKVIDTVLSQTDSAVVIPHKFCACLLEKVNRVAHSSNVKIRECCVEVLKALSYRAEAGVFVGDIFKTLLDVVLDFDGGVQSRMVLDALGGMARQALLHQQKESVPRVVSQPLHSSFVGADFENLMRLFESRERDESEWNGVCRQIMDRIEPDAMAFGNSDVLLGAVRQAAAWCIQNRLRTHFGGPAQTFSSIEQLVQEYSNGAQSLAETAEPHQLAKWLMLEFVTALEMSITRAIYATEIDQSNPDAEEYKAVLFFRTNKVVCDDWLNRIRPFLVEMSRNGTSYELCRYHSHAMVTTCYNKLSRTMSSFATRGFSEKGYKELKQAEKDMDVALFFLCRCHCDAKDADTIIGFQKWGESFSSALTSWYQLNKEKLGITEELCETSFFRWLNAVRYEAEMRYEDAAAEYEALLQPVLTARSGSPPLGGISAAEMFEYPMTYCRMSSQALLGCFKQCAKCYASLREWTKLRTFVSQFVELTQLLVSHDRPIEDIQAIFDCSDMWSDEIGTIHSLEAQRNTSTAEGTDLMGDPTKRAALALRIWDVLGDPDAKLTDSAVHLDNIADRLQSDLIPLALQPSSWNGYAGDHIGKKAEETLLRILGVAMGSHFPVAPHKSCEKQLNLNPELYDSAVWSQPFSLAGYAGSADKECLSLTAVARLARKQHNFGFARSILKDAASLSGVDRTGHMAVNYEKAKLLETVGVEDEARRLLESECEKNLAAIAAKPGALGQDHPALRSLLHLSTAFAKADSVELLSPATSRFLDGTVASFRDEELAGLSDTNLLSDGPDAAAHKCLEAAIAISPKSSKAWIRYSHWCYDRGKREIAEIAEQNGYIHLGLSDESQMNSLLDEIGVVGPDRDFIIRAFCHFLDNGELVSQKLDEFHQLCTDRAPANHDSNAVNRLVQLQQACRSKVLQYFTLAARGYGKYFAVVFDDLDCKAPRQETTMVALRLLSLLTTYGLEKEIVAALEDVFANGPVAPWSYVVPQLIARAHHPVAAVSSLVCLILKRLARHSPHAIVYPAVVDSMEPQVTFSALQEDRGAASNSFAAVLQELQQVSAGQVDGVRLFISELRRVSILWDEAWISTLMKLSTDVDRRTATLEKEASRVDRNASLSTKEKGELAQRKLVAIMKPILVSVERLWSETCGKVTEQHVVSPHERRFLKEYGGSIEKAMEIFRDCCSSELRAGLASGISSPKELWQPFAEILKALLTSTGRRDQLPLHEISPSLASTSRQLSLTNMPGVLSGEDVGQLEPITIHRVHSSVTILRTKTKPKSLELIGSDGKTHKYLLKAREDLRLDERIMQFLRVTNEFLRADNAAASRDLSAQSYSVIPLSRNAGLIQMVPDVVPLFQVYTSRYEQQANSTGRAPQDSAASASTAQQQPPPPTAQFYAKLKQHGILNVSPNHRAQWPVPVLKQVYQELVAQRPRNVLQQEILARSEDLRESWVKNTRLSKSVAVMSVLGYIVGLGDRHLDNILLCVNSGDIVHIDHNVCFDKGRRLKVPEVVPFRLTSMLQDALGFTGVEGRFRVAFETTLRVVRSDAVREALLTLFEAFVYSPLVDWIADDKRQGRSGDLKARLEANVNLSLFLSRAEERRQDTISFGRQYDQLADAFSRVFKGAKVSFEKLLEQREQLRGLEVEERELLGAVTSGETELMASQATLQAKLAEVQLISTQAEEVVGKLAAFAKECWGRHQQIEAWRQKSVSFAETSPEARLHAVAMAAESASFQKVHATICDALERSRFAGQQTELLVALASKSRSVDTYVARLRVEIERLAGCLIPYLSAYSHWRKKLDAYLDTEMNVPGKDVYFTWWSRCSQCLRSLETGRTEHSVDTTAGCTAPSDESIAESTIILNRLSELCSENGLYIDDPVLTSESEISYFAKIDKLLQDISSSLSVIKLSNAQGQRLLKLAGASWMVKALEKLNGARSPTSSEATTFVTVLKESLTFQLVVAVSHASMTLLELVSTPKGSMKRLRANELIVGYHTQKESSQEASRGLSLLVRILQAMEAFASSFQEEYVLNLHGRQDAEGLEGLLNMIDGKIATAAGVLEVMDAISSAASDGSLTLKTALSECPATLNALRAAGGVVHKTLAYVDVLRRAAVVADERAEAIKNSVRSSWIQLTVGLIRRFTADKEDRSQGATGDGVAELWAAHVRSFISDCLAELLQCQLSNIISHDWKFDFTALPGDSDSDENGGVGLESLEERWQAFYSAQIPDILPSTLVNQPGGNPETQTGDVCSSVTELMNTCETWWSQKWRVTQSHSWAENVSSLRKRHERRLQYAAWLATQPMEQTHLTEAPSLTRIQLLTVLSSQVPYLNALLTQQATTEATVLELAQQLDYFASSLDDTSSNENSADESLHARVQSCYGRVAALFEYGRTLADLVQGISVIETSTGEHIPETGKIELEVDVVGESLLQSASMPSSDLLTSKEALSKINARVNALEDDTKRRQVAYETLVSRKRSLEIEFLGVGGENKDAVMETARVLSKHVKELRHLLKRFDKFKTPSKQNQVDPRRPRQLQSDRRDPQPSPGATNFCFMENDRLVKILLRSIRSVDHLQLLEVVLEKHGDACTALREAITQIDQALREYEAKADPLLTASSHDPQGPSLLLTLVLDLVEALRAVKAEPPAGSPRGVPADDTSVPLLVEARDLVRGCVKLFFEATEMADRLSSAEDATIPRASGVASLPEDEVEEEQNEDPEGSAPLALESDNNVAAPISGDSGSSAHDTTASTPRSVEEKSQYGLQVLKRIEEKLSGTVTEMAQAPPVLTVEQQASWLIDEATKTDNLCVMYEGWTPWI